MWLSHWLHDGMPAGETRDWGGHIYPTIYAFLLCAMQQPGSAMFATLVGLFSDPDQLAAVVADPTLIPRAVAEGMRWVAPPAWCSTPPRVAIADTEIAGFHVPKHTVIIQSYGSANHDETHWDTPTTFNLWRAADQHLAFGTGRRACPGGYFATAVCRIGLEELLRACRRCSRRLRPTGASGTGCPRGRKNFTSPGACRKGPGAWAQQACAPPRFDRPGPDT